MAGSGERETDNLSLLLKTGKQKRESFVFVVVMTVVKTRRNTSERDNF